MTDANPTGQIPIRTKGSTKCLTHRKDFMYFCATCQSLVCPTCGISEKHCKPHDLHDLSEVKKTEEIRMFIEKMERQKLPKLKEEIQAIDEKVKRNTENFKEISQKVKVQANKCKEEIDLQTTKFLSLCKKLESTNEKLLLNHQTELEVLYNELVNRTKECTQTLQSDAEVEAIDTADNLRELGDFKMPEFPVMENVGVYPQEIVSGLLRQALGLRETMYTLTERPIILTKFTFPGASAIFPKEREQAWILDKGNVASLVDSKGDIERRIRPSVEIGKTFDIAPKTGHVWFAGLEEKTIREFSLSSSECAVIKCKVNDTPRRLCITRKNRVLVGTEDKISLYTTSGVVLRTSVNAKTAPVIRPWKIVECPVTGNIAVGNEESVNRNKDHSKSHVIVFDKDLNTQFVYRGEDISRSGETAFDPGSLAYDNMGNLVVADFSRNTIELISSIGTYIKRIHKAEGCLQGNLGMQPGDVLWSIQKSDSNKNDEILQIKYYTCTTEL